MFGNPPVLPKGDDDATATAKHSKVAAKTGNAKWQCEIMQSIGIPPEEVHRFADPNYWIDYFPPHARADLDALGAHVDWRRSFVTTEKNPFYDSFVRWQFNKLRALDRIKFGKRHTIYSPLDGQPCLDHDRASGEGVDPKEYTAIKMELVGGLPQAAGKRASLLAATLRPETMFGQTNCWVGPEIEYGIFANDLSDEVYVCTDRAIRNLAHQDQGAFERLGAIRGSELLGRQVIAPLSAYGQVYVLPMLSISASKGTGIVTSVPSNSPDDYAALRDLVDKEALRAKYGLTDAMVLPFKAVPIIETPGLGSMSAAFLVHKLKIKSQNDRDALEKAKATAYKEDFYAGRMTVGPHTGKPVSEAKGLVRDELIAAKAALPYYEPENVVTSRSGDECVVALADQWYLDYGTAEWRALADRCVAQMNFYFSEIRNQFEATLAWMKQWACSRSFGLGSRIPWDPQYLIESLSDSTVYMAYYTVAHILHEGSLDGSTSPHGITPAQMTDAAWEYVFGEDTAPLPSDIPAALMARMRREFRFFYPLDLRVSGKDLVPNHLTMSIYNHVALFPERFWPRSFRANGHLLLNSEPMSKSKGNFMTIADAVQLIGADATRLTLADAGDSIEDANFVMDTANNAILRIYNLVEFARDATQNAAAYRAGELTYFDRVFDAELSRAVDLARDAYRAMLYREAVKVAFYELQNARDRYRDATVLHGTAGMHRGLLRRFVELQALLMVPILPHFAEHVWTDILGNPSCVLNEPFPAASPYDAALLASAAYLHDLTSAVRSAANTELLKKKTRPDSVELYVVSTFPRWQEEAIAILRTHYDPATRSMTLPDDRIVALATPLLKTIAEGSVKKKVIPFVMELKAALLADGPAALNRALPFDEAAVLAENMDYITRSLGDLAIVVRTDAAGDPDAQKKLDAAVPGAPAIKLCRTA